MSENNTKPSLASTTGNRHIYRGASQVPVHEHQSGNKKKVYIPKFTIQAINNTKVYYTGYCFKLSSSRHKKCCKIITKGANDQIYNKH
jgi:hypothetical protein